MYNCDARQCVGVEVKLLHNLKRYPAVFVFIIAHKRFANPLIANSTLDAYSLAMRPRHQIDLGIEDCGG